MCQAACDEGETCSTSPSGLWGLFVCLKEEKQIGDEQGSIGFIPPGISVPDIVRCHQRGPSKFMENVKITNLAILPPRAVCEAASACARGAGSGGMLWLLNLFHLIVNFTGTGVINS